MTLNEIIITVIIFVIIVLTGLFAIGLCKDADSDCTYSDPDKRIGLDGDEPEWKDE
jgi:hypothetical protein